MQEIRLLLEQSLNIDFLGATLSNPKDKNGITKVKVRPILKKDVLLFQCEEHKNNQACHHNYEVVEKKQVIMPDIVKGIVKCGNPKCITNNEPMTTIFHVICKESGIFKCHYCEKEQSKENIKLL